MVGGKPKLPESRFKMSKQLFDGTRDKLDYVCTKLKVMCNEFWFNDVVNARFTPNANETEKLECELIEVEEMIARGYVYIDTEWDLVKKYLALADEFRVKKVWAK